MNKESILGIVRHVLTFGGGFLTANQLASGDDVTTAVSALVALTGFVWLLVEKLNRSKTSA